MGLYPEQAKSIPQLEKREVIVSFTGYPKPFKVRVDEFSFPPKLDEMTMEASAQHFLGQVTWNEDSGMKTEPVEPDSMTGDVLRVFTSIAEKVEIIEERCQSLKIDRATEVRARKVLEAKGFINEEKVSLGKLKFYEISDKGKQWIERQKQKGLYIKIKHFKSGSAHEYMLMKAQKDIGSLNSQFKFQRNSEIAREHGIQPDLVLIQSLGYRTIVEIICGNIDREAKILTKERGISGVDLVIAIAANQRMQKTLQCAVDRCQVTANDSQLASLVILDAGKCLSPKFDWIGVFERP
jgi:DNA-binding PadR family transcriptional regulator